MESSVNVGASFSKWHTLQTNDTDDIPVEQKGDSLKLGSIAEEELPHHSEPVRTKEKLSSSVDAPKVSNLSDAKFREGMNYFLTGKLKAAYKCFNKSLKLNPQNLDSLHNMGLLLLRKKKYRKAVDNFEKILHIQKDNEKALLFLSKCLRLILDTKGCGDYREKFEYGQKLLYYNPLGISAKYSFVRFLFCPHIEDFTASIMRSELEESDESDIDCESSDEDEASCEPDMPASHSEAPNC